MLLPRLAFRNLARNTRRTAITTSAIALGMALLHFTICLQHGSYTKMLDTGIKAMAGHVVVQADGYQETRESERMVEESTPIVEAMAAAAPNGTVIRRSFLGGLLSSADGSSAVAIVAVEPELDREVNPLHEKVILGGALEADRDILIGEKLAQTLQVDLGDRLVLMAQAGDEMTSQLFRLKGVFKTGAARQDGFIGVITLGASQRLLGRPDAATQVTLHLPDPNGTDGAHAAVDASLAAQDLEILTWREALPELVSFIKMDRAGGEIMMTILIMIVTMGMFNTLLMAVLERTREFGVLLAIGMKPGQVQRLILLEGVLLGALGVTAGFILGALITWPCVVYGLDFTSMGETMETSGVAMSMHIYSVYNWPRMIAFSFGGLLITSAAAIWPAWRVGRLDPVTAMRHH